MLRREFIKPVFCGIACLILIGLGAFQGRIFAQQGGATSGVAAELEREMRVIRAVASGGKGNVEASQAWKRLTGAAKAGDLATLLAGMDGANDFAVNWLRSAVDAVAERAVTAGETLPMADLGRFLLDTRHHAEARRAAFQWIGKVDSAAASKLLPGMLNDPGVDLRREAVEQLLGNAKQLLDSGDKIGAGLLYQQALTFAREAEQIDSIAVSLRTLGLNVDLVQQFGFITQWNVMGPFDNTGGIGFAKVYPPEQKIDLSAHYDGKGTNVTWTKYASTNDHGFVDINSVYGKIKEVTAYAATEFHSDVARTAELRLGSQNGWKVWLNGKFLFGRDEYHRGVEVDQYRVAVQLQAGKNVILVKVCQNEQKEEWTEEWRFQIRITDGLGTPIYSSASAPGSKANGAKPL